MRAQRNGWGPNHLTDERHYSVRRRSFIGFRLATTASSLALLAGLAAAPALAQSVIVGGSDSAVTVNTGVLDQLGPGGTPAYDGQPGGAYYGDPAYGNFPPPQMPRSFSNVGNLTPPPATAPSVPQTQTASPQPASQPAQGASSSTAGLTPTQRLQQPQPSSQPAPAPAATASAAAQPATPEDMSADPAALPEEETQQATPTVSAPETTVASTEQAEPPAAPASATPEAEPEAEAEAEQPMVEPEETAPATAASGITGSVTDEPPAVPASETAAAAATTTPEPPPAPEPPEAPESATPAAPAPSDEPPQDEETVTADAAEAAAEETPETEPEEAAAEETAESTGESESSDAQTAARTTGPGPMQGGVLRVVFETTESDLPEDAKAPLKDLAQKLLQEEDTRIQLMAYASGDSSESSRARRLSLSRALAVRTYLIDQGIRSTRMDVRALGNNVPDGPEDRVDIQAAAR